MLYTRVTHNRLEFKDDCTELLLSVSLHSGCSETTKLIILLPNLKVSHFYIKFEFEVVFAVSSFVGNPVCASATHMIRFKTNCIIIFKVYLENLYLKTKDLIALHPITRAAIN